MADLVINPAVTETKVVEVSPATYTVTLSEEEFTALMLLVGIVSGDSNNVFRQVLTPLWEQVFSEKYKTDIIYKTGVRKTLYETYREQIKGSLYV